MWNKFGGRLAWDKSYICSNNPEYGGTGNGKSGEDYTAAPNIDHSQERVRQDIVKWLRWLRNSIGFAGWRFDFVKGYGECASIPFTPWARLHSSTILHSSRILSFQTWLQLSQKRWRRRVSASGRQSLAEHWPV